MDSCRFLVLAAGKGSRMMNEESSLAKVLRQLKGHSLLYYVLNSLPWQTAAEVGLIIGYQGEDVLAEGRSCLQQIALVRSANKAEDLQAEDASVASANSADSADSFASKDSVASSASGLNYFWQKEQLGTGHAVMQAKEWLISLVSEGVKNLLVAYGDMPLVQRSSYQKLLDLHIKEGSSATILSFISPIAKPFGRILRDENGNFLGIIEDKDANNEQKEIKEMNTGIYVFSLPDLLTALADLTQNNAQKEYYLTDVPRILQERGCKVAVHIADSPNEGLGVNTPADLAYLETLVQE